MAEVLRLICFHVICKHVHYTCRYFLAIQMESTNFCTFHFYEQSLICDNNQNAFDKVDIQDRDIIQSDIGVFFGATASKKYTICAVHKKLYSDKHKAKLRRYACNVPSYFETDHLRSKQKTKAKLGCSVRGDRRLTKDQMLQIYEEHQVVIPIGTCICRDCRKKWMTGIELPDSRTSEECTSMISFSTEKEHEQDEECNSVFLQDEYLTDTQQTTDSIDSSPSQTTTIDSLPSQTTTITQDSSQSQQSQISIASEEHLDKLYYLNTFLKSSGRSPVKQLQNSFMSSTRTQRRYLNKATECVSLVIEAICPDEQEQFKEMLVQNMTSTYIQQQNDSAGVDVKILKDIYDRAETWAFRRQILSILASEHSYIKVKEIIPELTTYRYYAARKHISTVGCGLPIPEAKQLREKINFCQLEPFITSSHIIKDLPFGERKLKLSTGEIVNTPNVIRAIAPTSIINQYKKFCDDEQIKPLGTSTMYKILEECTASVRHSVEGLDYYVAEGGRAFRDLEEVLEDFSSEIEEIKKMKEDLLDAKSYLKSDYKVHLREMSEIPDHCRAFSLSDTDSNFSTKCDHEHTESCSRCILLDGVLDSILAKVTNKEWDHKDQVLFKTEKAIDDIKEWKSHVLHSRNQEEARRMQLDTITNNDVLITLDWAMNSSQGNFGRGKQTGLPNEG